MRPLLIIITLCFNLTGLGCVAAYNKSVGADSMQSFQRIYLTDFNTAWLSVLDALKHTVPDVTNKEGGFIQTKWTDNTADKNLFESFGNGNAYLKAQFRFKVTVAKGFYNGKQSVKVTVIKEQLVERDVLEGWRTVDSDSIEENTLLYRIGRLIQIRSKIARIEEEATQKAFKAEK